MDEELAAFLNQRFEETRRHFDVVAEGLRGEIRVVAEGHLGLGRQLQVLREENESAHREILSAVKFSYAELDRRISRLESLTADLEARLSRLEPSR
jgi:hypothetical protein